MLFRRTLCGACCAALFTSFSAAAAPADNGYEIAYMSDVHFHDVYAHFEDGSFKGLPSAKHKNATIRTMYAQLTSTRLFNENYFAFLAALDDAVARGLKVVVISGDFSDGQPVHMRGLREVMEKYRKQHGLRFLSRWAITAPAFPFVIPAGKRITLAKTAKTSRSSARADQRTVPGTAPLAPRKTARSARRKLCTAMAKSLPTWVNMAGARRITCIRKHRTAATRARRITVSTRQARKLRSTTAASRSTNRALTAN